MVRAKQSVYQYTMNIQCLSISTPIFYNKDTVIKYGRVSVQPSRGRVVTSYIIVIVQYTTALYTYVYLVSCGLRQMTK